MPVPFGVEHREAPERLPDCSKNPMGVADLSQIRWLADWSNALRRRPEASWFAQTRRVEAREGTSGGESSRDGPGVMHFEGGSVALEPRPWNQGEEAQVPWSRWSFQTSYSSEFEAVEHHGREGAAGAATHHGLCIRKSHSSKNPRSGSGPSESARPEGDEPVEGAKNPEDGSCRVRQTRVMQIPLPMSLKGRETPGGATRPGMAGEGMEARTLRGR